VDSTLIRQTVLLDTPIYQQESWLNVRTLGNKTKTKHSLLKFYVKDFISAMLMLSKKKLEHQGKTKWDQETSATKFEATTGLTIASLIIELIVRNLV